MTIDRETSFIKYFFTILFLLGMGTKAISEETIYNFSEIKERRSAELSELYAIKLLNSLYEGQPLNVEKAVEDTLKNLQQVMTNFKAKNSDWAVGENLLTKLDAPNEFSRMKEKVVQLVRSLLIKELEYDPKSYIPVYYTVPRIIFDFRDALLKKLDFYDPKIKDRILTKLDRNVFKEGHKEGYLKELDKRFQLSFSDAQAGGFSIFGKRYSPGMTYFSQSYTVLANFSLFDQPYNVNFSALFQFLAKVSSFKEPYGILSRDLKRIFPRSLEAVRESIEDRLMRLQTKLDEESKHYLVQHFINIDLIDNFSHLEFFGFGFPIYLDKNNNVDYRETSLPLYSSQQNLLSPDKYRRSFIEKGGNPKQYHSNAALPPLSLIKTPVYPLRLDFSLTQFPHYELYKFPGIHEKDYRIELDQIVEECIQKLSTVNFQAESSPSDTIQGDAPNKRIVDKKDQRTLQERAAQERVEKEIKTTNPDARIITGNQATHTGGGQRATQQNQGKISGSSPNSEELGDTVSGVVQDLAKKLFKQP